MRTRSDAVCADTQAVVSLTTFLSPPSTCRPTNAAQLRQKSAGNGLGTECWAQGSASWGKGQGRKWREGERKTALAHAGGQACPQGGSSALGVALQQGQPNTPCSPLPRRGHRQVRELGWPNPTLRLLHLAQPLPPAHAVCSFCRGSSCDRGCTDPQAGNVYWAFHRKHLPTLAPDTLPALLCECGAHLHFLGS